MRPAAAGDTKTGNPPETPDLTPDFMLCNAEAIVFSTTEGHEQDELMLTNYLIGIYGIIYK